MSKQEQWVVLSGCNQCINIKTCEKLGNCVMLTIDQAIPEYNKRKRKLITRIRNGADVDLSELTVQQQEVYQAPTINLTVFEKAAIECLNKKRYKDETNT
jgi:hypothetical protein